ncbi:importin-11 [Prorops nasuta]|uniref:importin-11 n=1 Tax=Prorops nasuta TaxID=863751 RepID=UPI0034CF5736
MDAALTEVLQQASSQNPDVLKSAEKTLKEWESESGFYMALYNIFSNHSLDVNTRWMAILYFKNGIDRYWRKTAPGAIAEEEKECIRVNLISNFDEPINQLAVQLAIVIGKIARYDCPKEWSTLVPTLLEVIRGENSIAQHRALLTLHYVVKSLASKRLLPDKRLFEELTKNTFSYILYLWNAHTESFLTLVSNGGGENEVQASMERALLLLRILRRLTVNGFNMPSEYPDCLMFLKFIFTNAKATIECRKMLLTRNIQLDVCDKFIILFMKILTGVIESHLFCFVDLIPTALEFLTFYCFTEAGQALAFKKFLIFSLNLMNSIILNFPVGKLCTYSFVEALIKKGSELCQKFFTKDVLTRVCSSLISNYLLLTSEDLELWDSDPEDNTAESEESSECSLRSCSRSFYRNFFEDYKDTLRPVLVELMQRYYQPVDPNDLSTILLKDAVYQAVGLVAFEMYDEVNFDEWFSTTLREELKIRSNNYRIIRRRVCWLIGEWIHVKLSAKLRPEVYKLLVEALSPDEDLKVRLAASTALRLAVDDFEFSVQEFVPFLESAFPLLFTLLKEVNKYETKMHILYEIALIIERVGNNIKPHVAIFITYLSLLWHQSENHNMIRCAIMANLVKLEIALGSESVFLQSLVVSAIAISCDVSNEEHVYLLEDGLELWLALLGNVQAPTPVIMELFKNMPAILENSSDNLKMCLLITQGYILLSPNEFLSQHGAAVIEVLKSIVSDMCSEGLNVILDLLEIAFQAVPHQSVHLIRPLLLKIFQNIYSYTEIDVNNEVPRFLFIMSRVLLYSKECFVQIIREFARQIEEPNEEVIVKKMVSLWINWFNYIFPLERKKLLSLALLSFMGENPSECFAIFQSVITIVIETLNDITDFDTDEDWQLIDSLTISDEPSPSDSSWSEHALRRKRLDFSDPVHRISLTVYLQTQLRSIKEVIGEKQFEQLLLSLKKEDIQQLQTVMPI